MADFRGDQLGATDYAFGVLFVTGLRARVPEGEGCDQ